ncbi:MAG TPA: ATP-binding protein [Pyrinomonadaceae bacterium]|jgi:serine/threonine-protein kinase RsbW
MSQERILAHVARHDFVGRDAELHQFISYASQLPERKLLLFAAPTAGGSEFLRQAYDELFFRRASAVPICFAFGKSDLSLVEIASDFFRSFLQQYIAYRRVDPSLCVTALTFHDIAELALPTDYEAVTSLIESFERERGSSDELNFLRFCLAAPHKLAASTKRTVLPLIDCLRLAGEYKTTLTNEIVRAFLARNDPAVVAGLRRQMPNLTHEAGADLDAAELINLDYLGDEDAHILLDTLTRKLNVESSDQTRDLIVQQLRGSPFSLAALAQSAREESVSLTNFLNCQRLYVDELMGGRIHRHFSNLLSRIAPQAQTRRTLIRVLYESGLSETRKASVWTWKKRLGVEGSEFEHIIEALHVHELANSSGATIELNTDLPVWTDYLQAQYQLEVAGEARALTVANALLDTLKRAPQTMRRKYRREAALGLKDLLSRFNCQEVPASLFHYDQFAASHTGFDAEAVNAALDAEADIIRLPQVVSSIDGSVIANTEPGRCAIAHGFEAAEYTDENEIVWIAVEIDSKLEAGEELTKEWCERLALIARENKFGGVKLWLVSPEGFTSDASKVLKQHDAYGSSRQQVELLTARLQPETAKTESIAVDEYEMVIPMGTDTELIAAHAVEQIARRINFRPDAINQIKLALVEACINATEHSLSPDRKIYQRFRVEDDKLVVTVASRGVVPAGLGQNGDANGSVKSRRGWGLKLIKTLMDEVEFERVDDGTQLRMTKFRK